MRYKASSVSKQWAQCKLGNFRNVSVACEHSKGGYSSRYITLLLSEQQCLQRLQKVILALDVANTHAFITISQILAFFLNPQEFFFFLFFKWKFPTPYKVTGKFGNVWAQKRDSEIPQTTILNTQIFDVYPICRFVVLAFLVNYSNLLFS